jgi:hypothetical protein
MSRHSSDRNPALRLAASAVIATPRQFDAIRTAPPSLNDASSVRSIFMERCTGRSRERRVNRTLKMVAGATANKVRDGNCKAFIKSCETM